jgi:hypothetical protein
MSQSAISRIWRAFGLKPQLVDTFKLSTDPQFICKVRDVVGLYLNPPRRPWCWGWTSRPRSRRWSGPSRSCRCCPGPAAGHPRRSPAWDHNLYAALDVASGKVISQMTARHRAIEFRRFLDLVDNQVPAELAVHVIGDHASTHKPPAIQRWLTAHPRVALHFTPTTAPG